MPCTEQLPTQSAAPRTPAMPTKGVQARASAQSTPLPIGQQPEGVRQEPPPAQATTTTMGGDASQNEAEQQMTPPARG